MTLTWHHTPGSHVSWKTESQDGKRYSIGRDFHGFFQAIESGHSYSKPIGPPCITEEEAKLEVDKHLHPGAWLLSRALP